MKPGFLEYYLTVINIACFILFAVSTRLRSQAAVRRADIVLTAAALLGGSAGVLLSALLFDRKPEKDRMLPRVIAVCAFAIQLVGLLILTGHVAESITWDLPAFFSCHKILAVYLGTINLVTFAVFAADKRAAVRHRPRVRIVTLLGLAFLGGSLGGLLAMYLLRHKTQQNNFTVGIPLIIVTQIVVLLYSMNASW